MSRIKTTRTKFRAYEHIISQEDHWEVNIYIYLHISTYIYIYLYIYIHINITYIYIYNYIHDYSFQMIFGLQLQHCNAVFCLHRPGIWFQVGDAWWTLNGTVVSLLGILYHSGQHVYLSKIIYVESWLLQKSFPCYSRMIFNHDHSIATWSFFPEKNDFNMFFMNDQHLPSGYLT